MSLSILFYSLPVIPLFLSVLSSMMEKPINHWMIFLTIVQLMLILMTVMITLINLHWETNKEMQVDVVKVVDVEGKVVVSVLVKSVKLTVDVDAVVVVVKVVGSMQEIVHHQLLHGKIWKIMKNVKIETLWKLEHSGV